MGKNKRRLNKKELNQLYKIENLLQNTEQAKPEVLEARIPKPKEKYLIIKNHKIPINSITLSSHGLKRSIERLDLKITDEKEVTKYIRDLLCRAEYMGRVTATDDEDSEMFIVGSNSIHLTPDFRIVKTVLKFNKLPYNPLSRKIKDTIHREFRKLDRSERAKIKQLQLHRYETEAEIAELQLRKFKSRSESVKFACEGRIIAFKARLQECENEIVEIKNSKRQIAYAYATMY